jgi:glycerate-2-kinase
MLLLIRLVGLYYNTTFKQASTKNVFPSKRQRNSNTAAKAAHDFWGDRIKNGVVVTKYDHVMGPIANFACYEAGHPVPDENSFNGTQAALELVSDLVYTGPTGTNVNDVAIALLG